jgi:hypothetical protein
MASGVAGARSADDQNGAEHTPVFDGEKRMDASDELKEVVAEERFVRLIEEDIYSVLPDTSVLHHYDKGHSSIIFI